MQSLGEYMMARSGESKKEEPTKIRCRRYGKGKRRGDQEKDDKLKGGDREGLGFLIGVQFGR